MTTSHSTAALGRPGGTLAYDLTGPADGPLVVASPGLGGPAEVLLVDGAGHYPHVERPYEVTAAVLAFLDGLR